MSGRIHVKNRLQIYFFEIVAKDIIASIAKLVMPQNTEPKKIKDSVVIKITKFSILLKKNGVCNAWSIKQINDSTIIPVRKPLL